MVMLAIKFFFARSNTWISFVMFLTTASDSVAFSRMRDIWPSRSYNGERVSTWQARATPSPGIRTDIISCIVDILCGSWLLLSSVCNKSTSFCSSWWVSANRVLTSSRCARDFSRKYTPWHRFARFKRMKRTIREEVIQNLDSIELPR